MVPSGFENDAVVALFGTWPELYMNISIVAKTSLAIFAVVALVAMAGAVTTGAADLLNAAVAIAALVVVGSILVALIRFR